MTAQPIVIPPAREIVRVPYTGQVKSDLALVNRRVNVNTQYVRDIRAYGLEEYWAVAGKKGDCEDIALAKLKMLRTYGWPRAALDIAICKVNGEGHAVLIAHTDEGDFVLDNTREEPIVWSACHEYQWLASSVAGSFLHWKEITNA